MSTIAELRQKIQDNNFIIKGITKNPQLFIDWKITDLKNKNTVLAGKIKELKHLYQ